MKSIRFWWFPRMTTDQLKDLWYLTDTVRVVFWHLGVKYCLVLFLDLNYVLLDAIDKLVHMVNFAPNLEVSLEIVVNLFWLLPETVVQPLNLEAGCHWVNHYLNIFLAIFEFFHMNHHIPHFIVSPLDCRCDVFVISHEIFNNV